MHLLDLAAEVKEGTLVLVVVMPNFDQIRAGYISMVFMTSRICVKQEAGLQGMRFNTIGVSDAISMGTDGMSYSLQSRDLIADSIETVVGAHYYDGIIAIPGAFLCARFPEQNIGWSCL